MRADRIAETLRSGLGRRILGLFVLAALLPVVFTAYLAYDEIHRGLQREVAKDLKEDAKSYGIEILARLARATDRAGELTRVLLEGGSELENHQYLFDGFEAVWLQTGPRISRIIAGTTSQPLPAELLNKNHLGTGQSQLVWQLDDGHWALTLVLPAKPGDTAGLAMFRLDNRRIWRPGDNLPHITEFCVFTEMNRPVFCTDALGADTEIVALLAKNSSIDGLAEFPAATETYLVTSWQLFLNGIFASPPINIVAGQPESYALRSGANFKRVFPPALAFVIILVVALSFHLIGKSLIPIARLKLLAQRLAAGDLKSRIRLQTGDEFQALGNSFNYMADQLGTQFDALNAMSEIDRLILAGTDFEHVGEKVIVSLTELIQCETAGVIAIDSESPAWGKMITSLGGEFSHERVALPLAVGNEWCLPRQVDVELIDDTVAPYKSRFQTYGQKYVLIIPVVLDDVIKGILLLGSRTFFKLKKTSMQRCVDLAGRLAVALASAEREDALYRQAHFDELTGLPNRQLLRDRLQQQIAQARRNECSVALLFLDLDRFKEINDVYGHSIGDMVLIQAADRIEAEVRDTDTVARLGGDEFVVVLPTVHEETKVPTLASKLLQRLSEPFTVRGVDHFISASIGIVMFPDDGDSVETLLKNADAAMYRAKGAGRSRFEFFSEKLNAESRHKIELERDLRVAVNDGLLAVHYQPQFDLDTGIICGAEALLRWPHPTKGMVSPDEFVPLAEESGLVVQIGQWVLAETCRNLKSILDKGLHPGPVSINVSGVQLRDTRFIDDVLQPLRANGIQPGFIHLEITETAVAENRDIAIHVLSTLREEGVKISIDDFGTGYSSLSYLQQLPFDEIKIDKEFVDLIGSGDNSEMICRTIIKMAHEMGKPTVAEGVESKEQVDFLRANGCDSVQGYYYSKPLPPAEFLAFIEKQSFHTQRRKALELI